MDDKTQVAEVAPDSEGRDDDDYSDWPRVGETRLPQWMLDEEVMEC